MTTTQKRTLYGIKSYIQTLTFSILLWISAFSAASLFAQNSNAEPRKLQPAQYHLSLASQYNLPFDRTPDIPYTVTNQAFTSYAASTSVELAFKQPNNSVEINLNQESSYHLYAANNAEFNALWLRQFDEDYRYREGGAAIGLLLRLGVFAVWNNYQSTHSAIRYSSDSTPKSRGFFSAPRYSIKVKSDQLRVGLKYRF